MARAKNKLKLMDAPIYHYWQALYLSFYSKRLYIDVGKRWQGIGLLYFLLAIAVCSIPLALRVGINLDQSFNEQIIEPLLQVPDIYVQNGEASLDKPMPFLIKNKKDQVVLVVDTRTNDSLFGPEYPNLSILINKDKVYFKTPTPQLFSTILPETTKSEPQSQSFGKGTNFVFNGKKIVEENGMLKLKHMAQLMIYPIIVVILYSMFVVIFLVLAFLGQVFASIFFSFKISFSESSRVFRVA